VEVAATIPQASMMYKLITALCLTESALSIDDSEVLLGAVVIVTMFAFS